MPPPVAAIDALARKKRFRTLADAAILLAVIAFVAVYARLADTLALERLAAPPGTGDSLASGLPTGTRLALLPQAEQGTPVLDTDEEPEEEDDPANDLQRRIVELRERMANTVAGRDIDELTYVALADAMRMVGGDWRWDKGEQQGVVISDDGLVRFAADTSQVYVNEEPRRIAGPLRVIRGEPYLPLKAVAELYGASVDEDEDTGLVTVAVNGEQYHVMVPARLFRIEICRGGRWLKVSYAGKLAKKYPICSGAGNNTPVGHFHIQNKAVWPSWRAYWGELIPSGSRRNPLGARWLGTTARGRVTGWAIGIHGTNQPSSIGRRISGGCIRTYNRYSIELYETIPIGTPVWIHE